PFCDDVYISVRAEQSGGGVYDQYPRLEDIFVGFGPLGGILSAQMAQPEAAWVVLACDLPNLAVNTIEQLITERNPFKLATAFVSERDGLPEPLCAIYEPKSLQRLLAFLALGYRCPRKVLINSDTQLLQLRDAT